MPPAKKKKPTPAEIKSFEEMNPGEKVAHEILDTFADLKPSVQQIMQADLSDTQRHTAISSFRDALGTIGNPFRDPRYAIANCGPDDRS